MSSARAVVFSAPPRAAQLLPKTRSFLKRPRAWRVALSCAGALFAYQQGGENPQVNPLDLQPQLPKPQGGLSVTASCRWRAPSSRTSRHAATFVGLLLLGHGCRWSTAASARRKANLVKQTSTTACAAGRDHDEFDASVDTMETIKQESQHIAPKDHNDHDKAVLLAGILGALAFCLYVTATQGTNAGAEWLSCYVIEYTLSVDNLFLFILIFKYFELNADLQRRVLNFGIAGAIIFRLMFVYLGAELLEQANVLILGFAAILIYASVSGLLKKGEDEKEGGMQDNAIFQSIKQILKVSPKLDGDKFFTRIAGKTVATPLLLCLLVLESSDVVFATDSVPAIRGITQDPFIAYTSSIFAVFGMRSLFFLLRDAMLEFTYLEPAVNLILGFIGSKIVVEYFEIVAIPTLWSLGTVLAILLGGVILSIQAASKPRRQDGCVRPGDRAASSIV